ncbi:MAG: phosphoethanolamine transferase [Pyrinomonadaceae bacterium]
MRRLALQLDRELARRLAFGFTLFLLAFETYVVGADNSKDLVELFASASGPYLLTALIFAVATSYLVFRFCYEALSSRWPLRAAYLILLAISLVIEYSYQKALGRFSQVMDIELATATTMEQKIVSITMYFGYSAVIPIVVLTALLIFTRGIDGRGLRHFFAINGMIILVLATSSVLSVARFPAISTIAFYRTNVEFLLEGPFAQGEWGSDLTGITQRRQPITSPELAAGYEPDNNIIFVVDESVRGDHFSLNGYQRPTTPLLDDLQRRGFLHNWGIAAAASTGSHTSYNIIVTGLTPDDFPDTGHRKLKGTPTIFQYAKAMGYKTWFFDGQMDFFWGGINDDRRSIDNWYGVDQIRDSQSVEERDIDLVIARRINKIISDSKGNFIFVFKHGSHVPYHHNFPPDQAVWQPSYVNENRFNIPGRDELDAVANAYDNSIRYNTNLFFGNLIDDYSRIPNNTVIVYTGDHGQTLFVNGKASHSGHTRAEATVPLFVIGKLPVEVDTNYKPSHNNLYPTILDLMNYPMEARERNLPLSLLKAKASDSRQRFFNPSYGAKMPFD